MGIIESFLDDLKKTIVNDLRELISEAVAQQTTDKWLNKKQLAEYWGVSVSWIDKNINNIPHTDKGGIYFLRSEADAWRKGDTAKQEVVNTEKVNVSNYKSDNFRVGKK